jgi:hypothetical protein
VQVALRASEVEIMKVVVAFVACLALTAISASGGEQLKIAVSPLHAFAPSNLNIRARVVPNADNRTLEVIAESSGFYRSSQIQLEGERSPASIMFEFRGLPGGEYQVYAILSDSRGRQRAIDKQPVTILSMFGE